MRVAHADWSASPAKRWMVVATGDPAAGWCASAARRVGRGRDLTEVLAQIDPAAGERCLLGVDFPIGLPRTYAERAGIASFRDALASFGHGRWTRFFDVADDPTDVSLERPFFPRTPGRKGERRRAQLADALGVGVDDLYRRCERAHPGRSAACPLFWTLGANQAGRAAIAGWQLLQALPVNSLAIWPFDGDLDELVSTSPLTVAEAYPAEFLGHLGLPRRVAKRSPAARAALADRLVAASAELDVRLEPELQGQVVEGFGTRPDGEDAFDAFVGLLGTINVVAGRRPAGPPSDGGDPALRTIEGWILGQTGCVDGR